MSKIAYNLHLKGYVGGSDFDRNAVDKTLAEHSGKRVNVLIDSLGGSLATGLSISAAFKKHGDVSVHFVGLNASATTIASLSDEQLTSIEDALAQKEKQVSELSAKIYDLQEKLSNKPADNSTQIVDEGKPADNEPRKEVEAFVDTYNTARALYNEV